MDSFSYAVQVSPNICSCPIKLTCHPDTPNLYAWHTSGCIHHTHTYTIRRLQEYTKMVRNHLILWLCSSNKYLFLGNPPISVGNHTGSWPNKVYETMPCFPRTIRACPQSAAVSFRKHSFLCNRKTPLDRAALLQRNALLPQLQILIQS